MVSQRPLLARLAAIAVGALVLTACSAINPITTDVHYAPSDGVQVAITDDAKALNLLVVTTAKGAPAVLTGSIYNGGEEDLAVTLSDTFDTRVRLELGRTKGRIVVEFATQEDLRRIMTIMAPHAVGTNALNSDTDPSESHSVDPSHQVEMSR